MLKNIKKILWVFCFIFFAWIFGVWVDWGTRISHLAGMIDPEFQQYAYWGFLAIGPILLIAFIISILSRPSFPMLVECKSESELRAHKRVLAENLRRNHYCQEVRISIRSEEDVDFALEHLKKLSDKEIIRVSRTVFISTALSRNGKLDGFFVFVQLLILVWRISCIYQYRPNIRNLLTLYRQVTYAAGISAFNQQFEISESVTKAVASVISSLTPLPNVPGLASGTAMALEGTVNAGLSTRVGVLTRRMLSLEVGPSGSIYDGLMKETATLLLQGTQEGMRDIKRMGWDKVGQAVTSTAANLRETGSKAFDSVTSPVRNIKSEEKPTQANEANNKKRRWWKFGK